MLAAVMLASCSNAEKAVHKVADNFLAAYFAMDNDALEGLCTAELAQAICQRDTDIEALPEHISSKIKEASAATSFTINNIVANETGDIMCVYYSIKPYQDTEKSIAQKMTIINEEGKWKVSSINREEAAE